jgi:hypothetical protein
MKRGYVRHLVGGQKSVLVEICSLHTCSTLLVFSHKSHEIYYVNVLIDFLNTRLL